MIYQAQNILLPMAVAKLTHNLAGSLSAHCVRIPALVQTTSFPWETITVHLFLGASRQFSNSQPQILAVQCSLFLFTQKWESLYLVSEFQCTPPQASSKRNECSYSLNFILLNIKLIFLKFLAFHTNAFGDTRPASLASEKKPLSAPTRTLTCNSPRQLGNNWTCIARPNICNYNVCFDTLIKSTVRSQSTGHSQFDDVSTTVSFLRSTNKLAKLKGALNESSKLETAVRPLEFFAFTVYVAYLKYWYPSRVYDIVNMIYQAQNILLPWLLPSLPIILQGPYQLIV